MIFEVSCKVVNTDQLRTVPVLCLESGHISALDASAVESCEQGGCTWPAEHPSSPAPRLQVVTSSLDSEDTERCQAPPWTAAPHQPV